MNEIKIPLFEGYDKGPRWEVGDGQAVAFEDGATFGYVYRDLYLGWCAHTICTAEDGEDEVECYFATAEDAILYVNLVYLDLQARIAEYTSELELELGPFELPDVDEELLEAMENMDPVELLEFLELLGEDDEI
jgi:hypothetical protein